MEYLLCFYLPDSLLLWGGWWKLRIKSISPQLKLNSGLSLAMNCINLIIFGLVIILNNSNLLCFALISYFLTFPGGGGWVVGWSWGKSRLKTISAQPKLKLGLRLAKSVPKMLSLGDLAICSIMF